MRRPVPTIPLVEQHGMLRELTAADAWQYVVVPNAERRCQEILRKLASDKKLREDPCALAELQTEFKLLQALLSDPKEFFSRSPERG